MDELLNWAVPEQDKLIPIPESLLFTASGRSEKEYAARCSCQECMSSCEFEVQVSPCIKCESSCEDDCQYGCETRCELSCQYACEDTCEVGCQVSCQTACEKATQAPKVRSSISISNIEPYSATVRITKNDASTIRVFVREAYGSQNTIWDTGNIGISQSTASHTLTGLSPSTTYAYNLWDDIGGWIGANTFTTPSAFVPFDWTYAGLDSDGSVVYGTEKLSGLGIYVKAFEWNDLAELVEDVTGNSVTRVSFGTTISAEIVNTMASALGVSRVSVGDEISAGFFNRLRSAYNRLG